MENQQELKSFSDTFREIMDGWVSRTDGKGCEERNPLPFQSKQDSKKIARRKVRCSKSIPCRNYVTIQKRTEQVGSKSLASID